MPNYWKLHDPNSRSYRQAALKYLADGRSDDEQVGIVAAGDASETNAEWVSAG